MKAIMSNQGIPFFHKLRSTWDIFRANRTGILGNIDAAIQTHQELSEVIEKHIGLPIAEISVLDLGCGQRATQTALFQADGANVIGVDYEIPTYKMGFKTFVKVIKRHGIERAVKASLRHALLDKNFFVGLSEQYGKKIHLDHLDTRVMDAAHLDFEDNKFDFIYSAWVFEHVEDVSGAIQEIKRVLKKGGIAWIGVHLFPSLSGGHNFGWARPDESPSKNIPPWDHLFESISPVNTYLNKHCLKDYRKIFSQHIQVLDEKLTQEGEKLLSPELEQQLIEKGYTREDLLTRTSVFLCKNASVASAC